MASVFARVLSPTAVLVALVVALLLVAAILVLLASVGSVPDPERLIGPFRWAAADPAA